MNTFSGTRQTSVLEIFQLRDFSFPIARIELRGSNPGEGTEVSNEMRLVEVSAIRCNLCPVDGQPSFETLETRLEPPYAAKQLRRQTNVLTEELDESCMAQSGFALDF